MNILLQIDRHSTKKELASMHWKADRAKRQNVIGNNFSRYSKSLIAKTINWISSIGKDKTMHSQNLFFERIIQFCSMHANLDWPKKQKKIN